MNFHTLYIYLFKTILFIQLFKWHQTRASFIKNQGIIEENNNIYFRFLRTMLKDSKNKIIMDWSAKAACSDMIAMFLQNMNIYQNVNYTGIIYIYSIHDNI